MRLLLFTILVMLFTKANAQINVDSLTDIAKNYPADTSGIKKIFILGNEIRTVNLDASIAIFKVGEQKALSIKNDSLLCDAYTHIGYAYVDLSAFDDASAYLVKAKKMAENKNDTTRLIRVFFSTAQLYAGSKQPEQALAYYQKAIPLCTKPLHQKTKSRILEGISGIYYDQNVNDDIALTKKSIDYSLQAFTLASQIKYTPQLINSGCNLALYYTNLKKYDSARHYLDFVKSNLTNDNIGQSIFYYNMMGGLNKAQKKYTDAIVNYNKMISLSTEYNSPKYMYEGHEALSDIYEEMGDAKQALQHHKKFSKLKDSTIAEANFAQAADLQNKYTREKKDKEILQLNIEKDRDNAKRKNLLTTLGFATGLLALLGVFIFLLYRNIQAKKKAYASLEKKNEEIKEQALQLSNQARLIAKFQTQMNPHFTFNALHNIYGLVATNDNEKAIQQIQSLAALMRTTLTNSTEEEITLQKEIEYLRNYIDFEKATAPMPFSFSIEVDDLLEDAVIPPMMIQPFIENAVKHAALHKVHNPFIKVLIEKENDLMKLIIKDNGKGIDKAEVLGEKLSHSMSIIKSRVELLMQKHSPELGKKLFSVDSAPSGTEISFYLPLNFAY